MNSWSWITVRICRNFRNDFYEKTTVMEAQLIFPMRFLHGKQGRWRSSSFDEGPLCVDLRASTLMFLMFVSQQLRALWLPPWKLQSWKWAVGGEWSHALLASAAIDDERKWAGPSSALRLRRLRRRRPHLIAGKLFIDFFFFGGGGNSRRVEVGNTGEWRVSYSGIETAPFVMSQRARIL